MPPFQCTVPHKEKWIKILDLQIINFILNTNRILLERRFLWKKYLTKSSIFFQ